MSEKRRFLSPDPRGRKDEWFISSEAAAKNNEFDIRFTFPIVEGKQSDIVIILNGFGEYDWRVYTRDREGICSDFAANQGIATVLLPMPFHFNRFSRVDYRKHPDWPRDLVGMIARKPARSRFWAGFTQALSDIDKLVRLIRTQSEEFYSMHFDENTRVHLMGYSLGGLGALSYQLNAAKVQGNACDSVILLSSGCSLRTLVPDEFKQVSDAEWDAFRNHFISGSFLREVKVQEDSISYRVFRIVVVGGKDELLHQLLIEQTNDIMVILGGEDMTNQYQWVIPERRVDATGIDRSKPVRTIPLFHTVIIPGMKHSLLHESWKRNQRFAIDYIAKFIKSRPKFVS